MPPILIRQGWPKAISHLRWTAAQSAVLTHVLAGRTRHRLWQALPSNPTTTSRGHHTQQPTWAITHDRGLAGGCTAESPPARPSLGGSRSVERGCTGRDGRCSRPRRRFGCRRRRAPSVRRRRRGVCHCASAQPCLDCSPTQAGQTLLGPAGACAWSAAGLGWHRPGQPRSAGRSRGARSRELARSAAVDPGPGVVWP